MGTEEQFETKLLRGNALAKRLYVEIAASRDFLRSLGGREPVLATLLVGSNAAAMAYQSAIDRGFTKAHIEHRPMELPAITTELELVAAVASLNTDPEITGVLILMPLPDHLNPHVVIEHLSPMKDVDGITPTNAGRLHLGLPSLRPSTPAGGLELLDFYGIDLVGREIVVVGRSNVVGRPLATLLTQRHATVTLCHRKTINLSAETRRADVVCVAAGSPGLITGEMIRHGATVLDFGVNVAKDGKIIGDADFNTVNGIAGALTPVPGGTGPVTTLVLARNTLAAGIAALGGNLDHVEYTIPEAMIMAHAPAS